MAVWQYTIELVPREKLADLFGDVPSSISQEVYLATEWWNKQQPSDDYETFLASFVAPRASWSEDVKCWGEEGGNRINVVLEKECVVEMSARFDLRNLDEVFTCTVVDFARRNGCVFLGESMELVEPSVGNLKSMLMVCDAARFVRNPTLYLDEIKRSRQVRRIA